MPGPATLSARRPSPVGWARRTLLGAVTLLIALVAWAPAASAHATLEASDPADGQTLAQSPNQVSVRFNEPVTISPRALTVFDANGHRVDTGTARHGDRPTTVVVNLDPHLAPGTYLVAWRVISADSHPVHGGFQFNVGHATAVSQRTLDSLFSSSSDRPYQILGSVQRWLAYMAALFAAGAAVFLLFAQQAIARATTRRLIRVSAALTIPLVAAAVPVQAALSTGEGLGSITKPGVLGQSLADGLGLQTLVVMVGALALLVFTARPLGRVSRAVGWIGAAACALGFVIAGHSRSTDPTALVLLADGAHLAAAAVWFGGVVMVGLVVRRRTEETTAAATTSLARFSTLATVSVGIVSVAGLFLAWREVRTLHALTSTAYGWLVVAKLGLAAALIGAGAFNHFRLVPVITNDDETPEHAWRRLVRIVRIEALLLVVVLGVTGVLVNAVPARNAAPAGGLYSKTEPLAGGTTRGTVNLVIDPSRVGRSVMHIYLLDRYGRPRDLALQLDVGLTLPSQSLGPLTRQPFKAGVGHYQLLGATFPAAGRWRVDLGVRVSKFERETASFEVDIVG